MSSSIAIKHCLSLLARINVEAYSGNECDAVDDSLGEEMNHRRNRHDEQSACHDVFIDQFQLKKANKKKKVNPSPKTRQGKDSNTGLA